MSSISQNELKPCPFCPDGGKPYIQSIGNEHTKKRGAHVGCLECGFRKEIGAIRYSIEWALEQAKEAWNTRRQAEPAHKISPLPPPPRIIRKGTEVVRRPALSQAEKIEVPLDIAMSLLRPDELEKLKNYITAYLAEYPSDDVE